MEKLKDLGMILCSTIVFMTFLGFWCGLLVKAFLLGWRVWIS